MPEYNTGPLAAPPFARIRCRIYGMTYLPPQSDPRDVCEMFVKRRRKQMRAIAPCYEEQPGPGFGVRSRLQR